MNNRTKAILGVEQLEARDCPSASGAHVAPLLRQEVALGERTIAAEAHLLARIGDGQATAALTDLTAAADQLAALAGGDGRSTLGPRGRDHAGIRREMQRQLQRIDSADRSLLRQGRGAEALPILLSTGAQLGALIVDGETVPS